MTLDVKGLACPAAAAAFGFRPLPAQLANGKGLVGFGIVTEEDSGRAMFEGMSKLPEGSLRLLALSPLRLAPRLPDVVVVEGPAESLMWLLLADLNVARGARRRSDTAVLQATCVDATVIPHLEKRLNYSLGCYGCREATSEGAFGRTRVRSVKPPSSTCTLMWTRLAKQAGVTEAEIAEAILVSRLMKMATVNDTAADALAWLEENRK